MKAQLALVAATRRLAGAGIAGAATDARRLLAHAMGLAPERLTLALQDTLEAHQIEALDKALQAREARQPVAQITGLRRFWGAEFEVTRDTLDPRPETEVLVQAALEAPFSDLLDLGTGTGCILLSLLRERADSTGMGVDVSPAALEVALRNAARLGLAERAHFAVSDWFSAVRRAPFDLIVSNPPYIAAAEMAGLAPEVRDWEPHLALSPGGDGLEAYRILAAEARARLRPGGRIALEIGPTQGAAVSALLAARGFERISLRHDLDGRDRVVVAYNFGALPPEAAG